MQRFILVAAVLAAAGSARAAITSSETARLAGAARVLQSVHDSIPAEYWNRAQCVAVIHDLRKAALIIDGEYGKGVMSCRAGAGWSAPTFLQLAKGSWGFHVGAEQIDVILLVMNEQGVQKLLQNKVTLGADASIAAGPVGRQAQVGTDAAPTAEIVSYSRARGLFAGIDLSGGVLRPDADANGRVYGSRATPKTILASREISAPTQAHAFLSALNARTAVPSAANRDRTGAGTPAPAPNTAPRSSVKTTTVPATDDDLRARVVDIQQILDRILADTTPSPVGTSGTAALSASGTVTVDRARLLQMREHLDALLAALNRR